MTMLMVHGRVLRETPDPLRSIPHKLLMQAHVNDDGLQDVNVMVW